MSPSVETSREFSRRAAIVGVGTTDFARDYQASSDALLAGRSSIDLAAVAFERAVNDAGLAVADVDGLGVCIPGAQFANVAQRLGVHPQVDLGGRAITVIPEVVRALLTGECQTAAILWGVTNRSSKRAFGGQAVNAGNTGVLSYYYYHPWGWSSQAAHWALMFTHYQQLYGVREEDFAPVAIALRDHAMRNDNAIMRSPLTVDDYMSSRYVIRPLHLFDLCVVNDGGVCFILQRLERARDRPHTPVSIAGWGHSSIHVNKFDDMVRHRLRPQLQEAVNAALGMADLALADIDTFQGYDASTIHLVNQLEGFGFVPPGEGLHFCRDGHLGLEGALPTNTSGGMLSEAYMMGWNHVAEITRQLRREAGERQIVGVQSGLSSFTTTESADPLIFVRED